MNNFMFQAGIQSNLMLWRMQSFYTELNGNAFEPGDLLAIGLQELINLKSA